ncbi:MAG TPA: hypothetical protein VGG44_09550 [Tepidisphaeraceae bacterium]|jgi:hypothetical protein
MPIQWDQSSVATIELSATGAITSRVQAAGNPNGIFPWLVIDQNPANISKQLPPLHPLDDSDCLIASTLEDDSPASSLFPGRNVLLHPQNFLEGPEMAWETLDAILFTPESLAKIPAAARANLFAAGVELAILSPTPPDKTLPWQQTGRWWIASSNLHLPPSVDPDAYAPTNGWNAGRSSEFRQHIFLLGLIFALLIAGIILWRSRSMPMAIIVVSIAASVFFWMDASTFSPIFRRDGIVRLIDKATIEDDWTYQVSHRGTDFAIPLHDSIHPVFFNPLDVKMMNLTIDFDQNTRPLGISGRLLADEPFALMTRELSTASLPISLTNPPTTPMRLLAPDPIYRDFKIRGELTIPTPKDSPKDFWPGIALQHR